MVTPKDFVDGFRTALHVSIIDSGSERVNWNLNMNLFRANLADLTLFSMFLCQLLTSSFVSRCGL